MAHDEERRPEAKGRPDVTKVATPEGSDFNPALTRRTTLAGRVKAPAEPP